MTTPPVPPTPSSAPQPPPALPYASSYTATADDRAMAMLIHICLIVAPVVSLVIWLIKREKSPFVEHHGKQALSFFIASLIAAAVIIALCFFCVGFILLPVFFIFHILLPILAGLAANRGEYYVYPLFGRLIR